MSKYLKYLYIICLYMANVLHADAQSITWQKYFHDKTWNGVERAIQTNDGGYLVPAIISNSVNTDTLWLIKLNKYGDEEWKKCLDSNCAYIESFVRLDDNTYMMIYMTANQGNSWFSNIEELDAKGDVLSINKRNSASTPYYAPLDIISLRSDSYVLIGGLYDGDWNINEPPPRLLVQKFDLGHNMTWSDTFGIGVTRAAIVTRDHRLIIGACVEENERYSKSYAYLLLLDTNGRQLNYSRFSYTSDSSENIDCMAQLQNGNIMVESGDGYFTTYFTLTDSAGNTMKKWEADGFPNGTGGFVPDGDSILVPAQTGLIDGPLVLTKFDTGFNQIWAKKFDDTDGYFNAPKQILRTSDNGLLLVGTREYDEGSSYLEDWSDMVLIKLDSEGDFVPYMDDNSCGMVYPNPTTSLIHISHPGISNGGLPLWLDIYDCNGKLTKKYVSTGRSEEDLEISFLGNGLYFYRLYDVNRVYCTGKFVKE